MPAPLLGPNFAGTGSHPQPAIQSYIVAGATPITAGNPVIFMGSGTTVAPGSVNLGSPLIAGIAVISAAAGQYVDVAVDGPVTANTSGNPATGAQLQIDATGNAVTTISSGKSIGYAITATSGGKATILLRLQ